VNCCDQYDSEEKSQMNPLGIVSLTETSLGLQPLLQRNAPRHYAIALASLIPYVSFFLSQSQLIRNTSDDATPPPAITPVSTN
jgi:hypothetical protein